MLPTFCAVSPLAGVFKCVLKLALAAFLASYLELVPMAAIGGILAYVAFNMVKREEVKQVLAQSRFHTALMVFTAVMVIVTDFLVGVLSGLVVYAVLFRFFDRPKVASETAPAGAAAPLESRNGEGSLESEYSPADNARSSVP